MKSTRQLIGCHEPIKATAWPINLGNVNGKSQITAHTSNILCVLRCSDSRELRFNVQRSTFNLQGPHGVRQVGLSMIWRLDRGDDSHTGMKHGATSHVMSCFVSDRPGAYSRKFNKLNLAYPRARA